MNRLRSWIIVLGKALAYFAYRLGLRRRPELFPVRYEIMVAMVDVLRWNRRLRVVHPERCVPEGPAVFAGNHSSGIDPFIMYRSIYLASQGRIEPRFMMREGIFSEGRAGKTRLLDLDEVSRLAGALHISREKVQLSQLKPFIEVLRSGESFIMYPGRTRSRSGLLVEYREGIDEPGAVSFFLVQAQRGQPDRRVACVPVVRTHNPVARQTAVAFGEPLYLAPDADRAAQRAFDFDLMTRLGDLVEINVPQVVSVLLYLHALHRRSAALAVTVLASDVKAVLDSLEGRLIDPAARTHLRRCLEQTLRWLAARGMIEWRKPSVTVVPEAVLAAPPLDSEYREKNPVKYLANQVLHMTDLVAAAERVYWEG